MRQPKRGIVHGLSSETDRTKIRGLTWINFLVGGLYLQTGRRGYDQLTDNVTGSRVTMSSSPFGRSTKP